jgi:hypothetical protein
MAHTDYRPEEHGNALLIEHWGFLAKRFVCQVTMTALIQVSGRAADINVRQRKRK